MKRIFPVKYLPCTANISHRHAPFSFIVIIIIFIVSSKPRFGINEIVTENGIVSDETSTANELNKYFVNILQQICKDNKARGGTPIHYLYGYVPPNWVVILNSSQAIIIEDIACFVHCFRAKTGTSFLVFLAYTYIKHHLSFISWINAS